MTESQIKESLIALLDGIKRADAGVINREMMALEAAVDQGRGALHPQLLHFLEGRSYVKALAHLGGDAGIPTGSCRPKRTDGAVS